MFQEGQDTSDARAGACGSPSSPTRFETLGIPLVAGRDFVATDGTGSPQVVIINETMAHRFWPGEDAIGKRFRFSGQEQLTEVVGIA